MKPSSSGKYSKNRNRGKRPQSSKYSNKSYDSNGPEGRLRGTAQLLVEKYHNYAKEALASGNTIMAESLNQHAEHYVRLFAEVKSKRIEKIEKDKANNSEKVDASVTDSDNNSSLEVSEASTDSESIVISDLITEEELAEVTGNNSVSGSWNKRKTYRRKKVQ